MIDLKNYGDKRQTGFCAYCGGATETRDHLPSKIFLDEPYPNNLPVVPACQDCNEGFSLDEEYVACLIECALNGSTVSGDISREKIRQILNKRPILASKLRKSQQEINGNIFFGAETERIRNIVLKLARGHAAFELNEPQLNSPSQIAFVPLFSMTKEIRERFEALPKASFLPEVGSRAMQRLLANEPGTSLWVVVQPGRYRYLTSVGSGINIRMVIGEYLACEALWNKT